MKFIQRLEAPKKDNKYYKHKSKGGYNKCIKISGSDCLPNCTGYAYGRFMEYQKLTTVKLPTSNAESWIDDNKHYKEGLKAKVGAIIVWKQGKIHFSKDGAGHVGIVEEVYADGSILVSNSAYGGKRFYLTRHNKNYTKAGFKFVGFIYPEKDYEIKQDKVDDFDEGYYILLNSKYIRTQPYVANNIVKVGECMESVKPKLTSKNKNDLARFKIGESTYIKSFTKDNKGNIWGKMINSYICVKDKTGNQVEKI